MTMEYIIWMIIGIGFVMVGKKMRNQDKRLSVLESIEIARKTLEGNNGN